MAFNKPFGFAAPRPVPSGFQPMPFEGNAGGPSKYPGVMAGGMPVPTQLPGWPVQQPISGGLGGLPAQAAGQANGLGRMAGLPPGFGGKMGGLLQALMARGHKIKYKQQPGQQPVPEPPAMMQPGGGMPGQSPFARPQAPPGMVWQNSPMSADGAMRQSGNYVPSQMPPNGVFSQFAGQAPPGFQRRKPGLFAGQPFSQQPQAQMPQMNSQPDRSPFFGGLKY